jgi:hypothetical protein
MSGIPEYDQGNTKLCGIFALKEVFASYGYLIDVGTIYQAVHGHVMPDAIGEAASFQQVRDGFIALCKQLGVTYQSLQVNDPAVLAQVVRDGWITVIGVNMADLQAGDDFGHFMIIPPYGFDGPNVHVIDSDRAYDGNATDVYPWTQVVRACADNWATPTSDNNDDGVAFKITGKAA